MSQSPEKISREDVANDGWDSLRLFAGTNRAIAEGEQSRSKQGTAEVRQDEPEQVVLETEQGATEAEQGEADKNATRWEEARKKAKEVATGFKDADDAFDRILASVDKKLKKGEINQGNVDAAYAASEVLLEALVDAGKMEDWEAEEAKGILNQRIDFALHPDETIESVKSEAQQWHKKDESLNKISGYIRHADSGNVGDAIARRVDIEYEANEDLKKLGDKIVVLHQRLGDAKFLDGLSEAYRAYTDALDKKETTEKDSPEYNQVAAESEKQLQKLKVTLNRFLATPTSKLAEIERKRLEEEKKRLEEEAY